MAFDRKKITLMLKRAGISPWRLAYDTMIYKQDLYRIITGKYKNPSFDTVEKISDYFKVNMQTFSSRVKEF